MMTNDPSSRSTGTGLLIGERLLLTVWIGSQWAIGYLAAPVLFHMMDDRQLAGNVAGQMFFIVYLIGLVAAPLLLLGAWMRSRNGFREWRVWVIAVMIMLIVIGMFVLQPMMQELKAQGNLVPGTELARQFGRLHGISSALYLVTSLLGLVLILFGQQSPDRQNAA